MNSGKLRLATETEYEGIRDFYWELIDLMADRTDSVGWIKGVYPTEEFLLTSIQKQELYVLERNGKYIAAVILNSDCNDGYEGIEWGIDCDQSETLVPHALGVHPALQGQGIGKAVMRDVFEIAKAKSKKAIRLDILGRNAAAEKLYTSLGFRFVTAKDMFYEDTGWTEFKMYELGL